MKRGFAALLLVMLTAIVFAPAAQAATCQKTSLLDIQDEVMCVICGVPLVNAGGPQSEDERNFIRARVEQCQTKKQIKAALVAEYTTAVLAVPQKSGFDLTAYIVPVVVLLAALIAIGFGAVKWSRRRDDDEVVAASAAEDSALDEDLRRYDL
jgi:cytochrome c-type biogenesis protein CcmH